MLPQYSFFSTKIKSLKTKYRTTWYTVNVTNACSGFGWKRANFLHSNWYVACLGFVLKNSVDNSVMFQLLLSSAYSDWKPFPLLPLHEQVGWGWRRSWEKTTAQTAGLNKSKVNEFLFLLCLYAWLLLFLLNCISTHKFSHFYPSDYLPCLMRRVWISGCVELRGLVASWG